MSYGNRAKRMIARNRRKPQGGIMRGDIPCSQMADLFERRKPHYPVSDAFGERVKGVPVSEWSRTERTHMVDWFRANETCGDGDYTRETPNESAKRCYNRLQAPETYANTGTNTLTPPDGWHV